MKFSEILKRPKKEEVKFKPAPPVFEEKVSALAEFTPEVVYKKAVSWVDTLFSKIDTKEPLTESPEENVKLFIDMLGLSRSEVIKMAYITPQENYIPAHSVNVLILSLATGQDMKLPYNDLMRLGTASLVHCVGRHQDSDTISIKHLTEYLKAKEKWTGGVKLLDNVPLIDDDIKLIVYQHHEMIDDMGLPVLKLNLELHKLTKILAIADFYVYVTQPPKKRLSISPEVALTAIIEKSGSPFDAEVVKSFVRVVGFYPIGSWVELSTGETGKVLEEKTETPMRPVIEVVFNLNHKKLKTPKYIDLSQAGMVHIKRVVAEPRAP